MFTDTMRENLLDSAQRVAGRKNRILNLGADVAGWAIRCAKGDEKIGEIVRVKVAEAHPQILIGELI